MRRRRLRITPELVERIWAEILGDLPPELRAAVENVAVLLEEEPSPAQREAYGLPPGERLYGMFEGASLPERAAAGLAWPARILLFRRPLEADFGDDPLRLRQEIRRTLLHELGHYFGLDEEGLERLGLA